MRFDKVTLEELLGELGELPSEWLDETAQALVTLIRSSLGRLRALDRSVTERDLVQELREEPGFLDVGDFAVPGREHPKAIIEAKGFEATGSKLTDFLGDILKIAQAKDFHMYFFLVTDGRGWHHRISDLRRIVEFHHEGLIDMIYTRARLADLAVAAKNIHDHE